MNYSVKLPKYDEIVINQKTKKYSLCIPIINEGDRFLRQLEKLSDAKISDYVDIVICDGGSIDGSTDIELLKKHNIHALLVKKSEGKLSTQLMMGYYYSLINEYEGVITMDGNCKDGVEGIFRFIEKLDEGYGLIQGSRYIKGGVSENTPFIREYAIKLIHAPIINKLSGFKYSDTTNGFRAHNIEVFKDQRIQVFRVDVFPTYALIHYLTVIVPRLGYKVCEVPVKRSYPVKGKTPTKISPIKGNLDLLKILYNLIINKYNPNGR